MPLLESTTYRPPRYLWNGHLQTVIPSLFRKIGVRYVRQRVETADDDFLDLDWSKALPPANSGQNPLVILSHGLEGDSTRQYMTGTVRLLNQHGFDCLAWHFRSCSGELNRQARFYHIGETGDLHAVIQEALKADYQTIHLAGYSAGGNMTLKYLGEQGAGLHPAIKRAVGISVPLDLLTTADRLEQWDSLVYNRRFQKTLKEKVRQKSGTLGTLPEAIQALDLGRIRSLRQFDDLITAPLHGFNGVTDYYTRNSSLPFLPKITVPTLVLNARNDPFLSPECFPEALAKELTCVWMEFPRQGGHCGFPATNGLQAATYAENRVLQFLTYTAG